MNISIWKATSKIRITFFPTKILTFTYIVKLNKRYRITFTNRIFNHQRNVFHNFLYHKIFPRLVIVHQQATISTKFEQIKIDYLHDHSYSYIGNTLYRANLEDEIQVATSFSIFQFLERWRNGEYDVFLVFRENGVICLKSRMSPDLHARCRIRGAGWRGSREREGKICD